MTGDRRQLEVGHVWHSFAFEVWTENPTKISGRQQAVEKQVPSILCLGILLCDSRSWEHVAVDSANVRDSGDLAYRKLSEVIKMTLPVMEHDNLLALSHLHIQLQQIYLRCMGGRSVDWPLGSPPMGSSAYLQICSMSKCWHGILYEVMLIMRASSVSINCYFECAVENKREENYASDQEGVLSNMVSSVLHWALRHSGYQVGIWWLRGWGWTWCCIDCLKCTFRLRTAPEDQFLLWLRSIAA
jgi:hypothetical protein